MSYDATVLAQSPTTFWPLNESTGLVAHDATAGALSATSPGPTTDFAFGRPSILAGDTETSLVLSGAAVGFFTSPASYAAAGDFTVDFWTKFTSTSTLMMVFNPGTSGGWIGFNAGVPSTGIAGGNATVGTTAVNDGLSHYVCWVRRTGVITVYIDGASVGTLTLAGTFGVSSAAAGLAGLNTGGYAFAGTLQKFRYDSAKALTSAQITATYSAGTTVSTGSATSYTLAPSPASVVIGTATTITASTVGGAVATANLVITLADSLASTIAGTITIAIGASVGSATVNPSAVGTHAITATHTGGGFSAADGSASFAATSAPVPTLTITSPVAFAPVGITGSPLLGSVVVSGTYTGTAPAAIEWNWSVAGTTYATSVATPTANAFTFTAAGLVPGNGTLTARFVGNTGAASVASLSVGDLVLAVGQSNQVGQGTASSTYQSGTGIASSYVDYANVPHLTVDPIGSTTGASDAVGWNNLSAGNTAGGSVWPIVASLVSAYTGRPCNIIMCAQDGAGLLYDATASGRSWLNSNGTLPSATGTATLFAATVNRAKLYGPIAVVDYHGCESDGIPGTTTAGQIATGLATLAAGFAANLPGTPPMIVPKLSDCPAIAGSQATIRSGIDGAWVAGTVKRGGDFHDILSDDAAFHFKSAPKLFTVASRKARAIIAAISLPGDGSAAGGSTAGTYPAVANVLPAAGRYGPNGSEYLGTNVPAATASAITKSGQRRRGR